jgi:hypothetical protein
MCKIYVLGSFGWGGSCSPLPYRLTRPGRLLLLPSTMAMLVAAHGRHNIGLVAAVGGRSLGKIRLEVAVHDRPHLSLCCSLQSEINSKPNVFMLRVNAFDHESESAAAVGAHVHGRRNRESGSISTAAHQHHSGATAPTTTTTTITTARCTIDWREGVRVFPSRFGVVFPISWLPSPSSLLIIV